MPVNSISLIRDSVLLMRDIISGTVSDPLGDRQRQSGDPGSNARFVMTSFPERSIVYPFITLGMISMDDESLGMRSESSLARLRMQVDVWSKQMGQVDGLAGSIYDGLRTSQLNSLVPSGLLDARLLNLRSLDEPGKGGVHRKSMDFELKFVTT